MPTFVAFAAAVLAGATAARWVRREWRRVNDELDARHAAEVKAARDLPRLKRDPASGEWRPS
jgi:hypothetical protein